MLWLSVNSISISHRGDVFVEYATRMTIVRRRRDQCPRTYIHPKTMKWLLFTITVPPQHLYVYNIYNISVRAGGQVGRNPSCVLGFFFLLIFYHYSSTHISLLYKYIMYNVILLLTYTCSVYTYRYINEVRTTTARQRGLGFGVPWMLN